MATPQLYGFTFRGLGEYVRLLLIDNDIKFENIRYDYNGKEWQDVKKTMIFGQMPCLKVDGQEIAQTGTMMRCLARKYNLNGSTEQDATFLDMFFEGVRDIRTKYIGFIYDNEESREDFVHRTLPNSLEKVEKLFKAHSGDFVLGNEISYADYALLEELDIYLHLDDHILNSFPELKTFYEKMWQRPNLKAYLEKRKADGVWINGIEKGMK